MSERVRNPQIQKRSSVLWSQKRPMSLQGVRVRGDAKFLLSQRLRSSSQLNGDRCETSHQSFSFWFKMHRGVSNRAITHVVSCWACFHGVCPRWRRCTLCAGSAGAEGKGLERCAAPTRSLRALQGCQKEPNAQWISATQRRVWQLSCQPIPLSVLFEYVTGSSEWHLTYAI